MYIRCVEDKIQRNKFEMYNIGCRYYNWLTPVYENWYNCGVVGIKNIIYKTCVCRDGPKNLGTMYRCELDQFGIFILSSITRDIQYVCSEFEETISNFIDALFNNQIPTIDV